MPSVDSELRRKFTAKICNIALRRRAEELLVIAAEVRRVFVAHTVSGVRRVQVFTEHQASRLLQTYSTRAVPRGYFAPSGSRT